MKLQNIPNRAILRTEKTKQHTHKKLKLGGITLTDLKLYCNKNSMVLT
jgi:hypothetical protein